MQWDFRVFAPESERSGPRVQTPPPSPMPTPAPDPGPGRRRRRGESSWAGYVAHPDFDDPDAAAEILAAPATEAGEGTEELLDPALERDLFRRMNFLLYRADRHAASPAEADRLRAEAGAIRQRIVRANQRLVIAMVRQYAGPEASLPELVSEGNVALLNAVERFDFGRGYRFSTYATRSVKNRISRALSTERRRRGRFLTGQDEVFGSTTDHRPTDPGAEPALRRLRAGVRGLLGRLNERERRVVVARFGLDGDHARSLQQLGDQLGITKERVRQIELAARAKLRNFASEARLDAMLA